MRKIILYIAQSIDGFIATPDGKVDWLEEVPNPDSDDYGYAQMYESIDTVIMGNRTYKQILGFDVPFPYADKKNYVVTRHKDTPNDQYVEYVSNGLEKFIFDLKTEQGKDIWLVGGGRTNAIFLENGWIDQIQLFIMPICLGEGIPLFGAYGAFDIQMHLEDSEAYSSGVVKLVYRPL